MPQQETRSFSLTDVIATGIARVVSAIGDRPETAADVRPPAALMFPGLSSPKTPGSRSASLQPRACLWWLGSALVHGSIWYGDRDKFWRLGGHRVIGPK